MDYTNAKPDSGAEENPNNISNDNDDPPTGDSADAVNCPRRTPFTDLSQVDADLALARTLQEQERAYMMLRMESGGGSDYGSFEAESYGHHDEFDEDDYDDVSEEDYNASDVERDEHASTEGEEDVELDPADFPDDEAYARALQDAEEREMAANLLALAGITEIESIVEEDEDDEDEDEDDHGGNSQDAWEEVDPDELSYEELLALGEIVGTESRGLSADTIASLPSINYKSQGTQEGISDSCVICRLDYEDGDNLIVLSCKHSYHSECINNWLQINKVDMDFVVKEYSMDIFGPKVLLGQIMVCPVCSAEVSTSGRS